MLYEFLSRSTNGTESFYYIIDFLYLERQCAQLIKNFHVYNKYDFFNIIDLCYVVHIVRLNIYIELILLLVLMFKNFVYNT